MPDDAEWVLLTECSTMAELHTLRATLEARGVPCHVHGEHTHGVLGPIHGAAVRSRVLVPRRALGVARMLAEDIVGPFDERPEPLDDAAEASPFRTLAEAAGAEDEDDEDDAGAHEPARGEGAHPRALRPRSYGPLLLVALLGGAFFGLSHYYVRRNGRAGVLAVVGALALVARLQGAAWAGAVLGAVALVDLLGGALAVAAERRGAAALELSRAPCARDSAACGSLPPRR